MASQKSGITSSRFERLRAPLSLGIDIGGTFTDLVILDPGSGETAVWKESTTPDDPSRGAIQGLEKLLQRSGTAPQRIGRVVHATTLFTNALIERKGAPTGLVTTAGFGDVLEIGRERKYELYDLFLEMPAPLVARPWRREVPERLAANGSVEIPLDVSAVLREVEALVADGVRSLAICFLHAYANPAHELAAAEAVARRFPDLSLSLSCDIAPEIREYPRVVTTVVNAYVKPLAETYLDRLESALLSAGIPGSLFLMLSNGGLTHVAEAKRAPAQLLESGPAAGALAGAWFSRQAGLERVLAFDMGGTTAKLALVDHGEPLVGWGFEAARQKRFLRGSGLPVQIATVELIEIGAGGGSIARASALGTLHVGPESAGAQPGPACYGRGGKEPTVTDADLTLGYLNAEFFLGGSMRIDGEAANRSLDGVAAALGLNAQRVASGVHEVVNENMAGAARVAIAERGRVPREYALLATGGAGPVHAWNVGHKLGVRHVVCPPCAGAGSTIGMLMAPARVDRVASFTRAFQDVDWKAVMELFADLERDALTVATATGAEVEKRSIRRLADMRYAGQGSEITVVLPVMLDEKTVHAAFEERYLALFGRTPPGAAIEFVALRLTLTAAMPGASRALSFGHGNPAVDLDSALKGRREVYFSTGGSTHAPVYDRYALPAGMRIVGPAVFEENESTFVIGPGSHAVVLPDGSLLTEMPNEGEA
jgi:N-methylhydantoinase A